MFDNVISIEVSIWGETFSYELNKSTGFTCIGRSNDNDREANQMVNDAIFAHSKELKNKLLNATWKNENYNYEYTELGNIIIDNSVATITAYKFLKIE